MMVTHLGTVGGIERWVSWCRRRRALVLWLRTEGRPAVSVELPMGRVLHELGVSLGTLGDAVAMHRLMLPPGRVKDHRRSGRGLTRHENP